MSRKEKIMQAVNNYKNHFPDGFINEFVYIDGAEWADNNPDEQMIAKYLYEKKGYPIDLNGHLPSFEETMKDVEKYNKYKEDKFIEKACNILVNCIEDFMLRRMETWDKECKKQTLENIRKKLEE